MKRPGLTPPGRFFYSLSGLLLNCYINLYMHVYACEQHRTMKAITRHKNAYYLLTALILLKMVLHYCIINPVYDLHRDEYLHLDLASHLSAGYLSVPPFTAFVSLLIKWLGGGFFWVKFFPALFGACTMVLVWRIVEELEGGIYAQLLAAAVYLFFCHAALKHAVSAQLL